MTAPTTERDRGNEIMWWAFLVMTAGLFVLAYVTRDNTKRCKDMYIEVLMERTHVEDMRPSDRTWFHEHCYADGTPR